MIVRSAWKPFQRRFRRLKASLASPTDGYSLSERRGRSYHPLTVRFGRRTSPLFFADGLLISHGNVFEQVSLIGAPVHLGQPLDGVEEAPQLLRSMGLTNELRGLQHRIDECGDLDFADAFQTATLRGGQETLDSKLGLARRIIAVGRACEQISRLVREKQEEGKFTLVLGGDHSISAGTLSGVLQAQPDAGVLWVDAHADINTPRTSSSGNIHGMPIGLLLKDNVSHKELQGFEWLASSPLLDNKRLVYIGLRDLDPDEVAILREKKIKAFSMAHIDKYGIGKVMEDALEHLGDHPLCLSFDIDALDPSIVEATGTKVNGGLTYRESHYICEAVAETGRLVHMDMVEVNPRLGRSSQAARETADVAVKLIASALGNSIL